MKGPLAAAVALLCLLFAPPVRAQTARGLEAALDALITEHMTRTHLPGAVVAVVKDGRVLFLKGYGYADLAAGRPVSPERTVFPVGSVSKPVTATAVLQLAERGRLRLDENVNRSLKDLQVPRTFPQPITPAQLLTHTAGFDSSLIGTASPRPDGVLPLGRYLAERLPPRVRPPGRVLAYSNHGYTLLGHLIEAAAGVPFPRYLEENVFRPLGMLRSSFAPVPALAPDRAVGYELRGDGEYRAAVPVHPRIVPAASLETTAADMARFLLAHLEGGTAGGGHILQPETVAEMHRRHFSQEPRMPGMAWGFFESFANGRRCLFHGGGLRGFMAGVYLWPESRLGLFVADNGYDAGLVEDVALALLDHELPFRPPILRAIPGGRERARRSAGSWRLAALPVENLEKAAALRQRDFVVTDLGDGALGIWGQRFVEVSPWLFQDARGQERVAFVAEGTGPARLLVTEELFVGNQTWERVPWYASGTRNLTVLLLLVALFLSALFARPAEGGASLFAERPEMPPAARRAVRLGITLAAVDLSFLVLIFLGFRRAAQGAGLLYGLPFLIQAALALPLLGAPLALALPVCAAQAWRERFWSTGWRLYYTLLACGGVAFLVFLAAWNLLGFRY